QSNVPFVPERGCSRMTVLELVPQFDPAIPAIFPTPADPEIRSVEMSSDEAADEGFEDFDEDDFDDDFDDDFEEEVTGEYELEDDEYGAEFLEQNPGANFGDDFGGGNDDDDDDDDGDDDFGDDDEDQGK
ncbi:MAG: hypothetical protein VYC71_04050, partial [Planctomycetota bacterium]|nr:hypothetical protein [Planctomycetota bacterium]